MNDLRRRLLSAQENNPYEKLDYLTIIPIEKLSSYDDDEPYIILYPATFEFYDEDYDEYYFEGQTIEYSLDDGITWREVDDADGEIVRITIGQTLKLRAEYEQDYHGEWLYPPSLTVYGYYFNVCGTPMSLMYGDDFSKYNTTLSQSLGGLFAGNWSLLEILNPKTFLPAKTVLPVVDRSGPDFLNGYSKMFFGCGSLKNAPDINAEYVGFYCCANMFENCDMLEIPPKIYTKTMGDYAFQLMFYYCNSLKKATSLLTIQELTEGCFGGMYRGCTSLTEICELPWTELKRSCYGGMFYSCSSLKNANIKLPAVEGWPYCYDNMFDCCNFLENGPEICLTSSVSRNGGFYGDVGCCTYMFRSCYNLKSLKVHFPYNNTGCYEWGLNDSQQEGTLYAKSGTGWSTGGYGYPPDSWEIIYF